MKRSTTITASSRADRVGEAEDKAVDVARGLGNRARLERQTAAYFEGLTSNAASEEADLEDALSAASQEMDFDQP